MAASKRKRGGQPGNQNARTTFYPNLLRPGEADLPEHIAAIDLSSEIELIRLHLRQFMEAVDPPTTLAEHMNLLRVISLAACNLTRLVRAQNMIHDQSEIIETIRRVADQVRQEKERPEIDD